MHMVVECEQSGVKEETAPTAVQVEIPEHSASSGPRGASAAGNVDPSSEQHVARQQSEHRDATFMTSAVKEEDNEEELNVEESSASGNDDFVQLTNDVVTGDDGNGSPVIAATTTEIPTSEVLGGKKRSREAASSTLNVMAQTRSKKRAKFPHSTSTVHDTSEEAGTTSQPRVVRRARRAMTKAHEGTFGGSRRGMEGFMPVVEEDGPPVLYLS